MSTSTISLCIGLACFQCRTRRTRRLTTIAFRLGLSLLATTTLAAGISDRAIAESSFGVLTINLCDNETCGNSPASYATQIATIADLLKSQLQNRPPWHWGLIGLNEALATRVNDVLGVGWDVHYRAESIPCVETGQTILTTTCFAAHLQEIGTTGALNSWTGQRGEVGIVAHSDIFDPPVEVMHARLISAKEGLLGRVRRDVLGVRLIVKADGYILPFYSTHLTGRRSGETRDLINVVLDQWKPGDLTPIVVGDFNFASDETNRFALMSEYFELVGRNSNAGSHIEHIWIGKQSKFLGSIGVVRVLGYDHWTAFNNPAADLSDHAVPIAFVTLPGQDCILVSQGLLNVISYQQRWLLRSGQTHLAVFDSHEDAARALEILQTYKINRQCLIGRGMHHHLTYYLAGVGFGTSPIGATPNEDCVPFDPSQLRVQLVNKTWTLVAGHGHYLSAFGESHGAALRALHLVRRFGFNQHCFVGRPNAATEYWRR